MIFVCIGIFLKVHNVTLPAIETTHFATANEFCCLYRSYTTIIAPYFALLGERFKGMGGAPSRPALVIFHNRFLANPRPV